METGKNFMHELISKMPARVEGCNLHTISMTCPYLLGRGLVPGELPRGHGLLPQPR